MNRRAAFLLLLSLLALPSFASWYSAMSETETFDRRTPSKVLSHKVNERAVGTHLHVKMRVDQGSVELRLLDSTGAVRLHRVLGNGTTKFDQEFAGRSGPWKVQLDFRRASGKYSVKLVDF